MSPNQTIFSQHFVKLGIAPFACMVLLSVVLFSIPATVSALKCIKPDGTQIDATGNPPKCIAPDCEVGKICNPTKYSTIDAFLLAVVGVVVQYGLLLIVLFLVLAGFKFVVAQGNPEKINDAKKMLVWVVVGAFVLIGVFVIRAAVCGTIDAIKPPGSPSVCST